MSDPQADPSVGYSIIVPVYNEEENLPELYRQLAEAIDRLPGTAEIVMIDDGSRDGSFPILVELAEKDPRVKAIRFRRNFGQTAAICAGIDHSSGRIVIPIDADLQNDPADIPRLAAKLREEDCDVVSGWRRKRQDAAIRRKLPSMIANRIISWVTGVRLHDYGCTLKAYRRETLEHSVLYGEMHRFIPVYASWAGAKVVEIEVNHRKRMAGRSKYGLGRIFKVILDLITVKFLSSYATKPTYFFGRFGLMLIMLAGLVGVLLLLNFVIPGGSPWAKHTIPMMLAGGFLLIVGIQSIMMGVLAEIEIRTYHESQHKKTYLVRETRNLEPSK